jgi:hypothetical protein
LGGHATEEFDDRTEVGFAVEIRGDADIADDANTELDKSRVFEFRIWAAERSNIKEPAETNSESEI